MQYIIIEARIDFKKITAVLLYFISDNFLFAIINKYALVINILTTLAKATPIAANCFDNIRFKITFIITPIIELTIIV